MLPWENLDEMFHSVSDWQTLQPKLNRLHYVNIFISLWLISSKVNTHTSKHRFLLQQAGVVMVAAVPPETMRSEGRETKREYWGKWTWPLRCLGEEGLGACWYLWIYNESQLCMCVCICACKYCRGLSSKLKKGHHTGGGALHLPSSPPTSSQTIY